MAEIIEDLTVRYEEDGKEVVKEIDKSVLTRGSWTTIVFLYQELDSKTGEFGPNKVSIRRYRKRYGQFRQQSKFNISSEKQVRAVVDILTKWFPSS